MTRRGDRAITLLTLLGDLLAITVAFQAAVRLRIALNPIFRASLDEATMAYLVPPLGLILILWVVASAWLRLYRRRQGPAFVAGAARVIEAMVLVLFLTIVVTFFVRDLGREFSRAFIVFLAALGVVTMLLSRLIIWAALRLLGRRALGRERVLVIGRGKGAKSLITRLERTAGPIVDLCGVVTPAGGEGAGVLGNPVPIVGTVSDLPVLINAYRIDRVIAVEKEIPPDDLYACISVCTRMGVPLNHTAGILQASFASVGVTQIAGMSLLEVSGLQFTRTQEILKRAFDLVAAAVLLLVLSPLLFALAILIVLTSPGPVLYVSQRVGRGGRHFRFFKFRSMVNDADERRDELKVLNEKRGHLFKIKADPRVTPIGRLMRRFSLDELPQLLNVLRGDMSLVGPRPLPALDLEPDGLSHDFRFWAKERCKVPPGVTGLWQVRGRSELAFDEMLRLDVAYVRRFSLLLDIRILMQTIPVVLKGRGAC